MTLKIPDCPECGERANHAVDFTPGKANLQDCEEGPSCDFDYAGGTDVDWDGQENALALALRIVGKVENLDKFMLVGCCAGHQWITGVYEVNG